MLTNFRVTVVSFNWEFLTVSSSSSSFRSPEILQHFTITAFISGRISRYNGRGGPGHRFPQRRMPPVALGGESCGNLRDSRGSRYASRNMAVCPPGTWLQSTRARPDRDNCWSSRGGASAHRCHRFAMFTCWVHVCSHIGERALRVDSIAGHEMALTVDSMAGH